MWIVDPAAGLISIVASDCDPTVLVCRARTAGSLRLVFGPETEEIELDGRDYAFRAFIPRETVGRMLAERIAEIQYFNVKAEVSPRNHVLKRAMGEAWHVFAKTQVVPPYTRRAEPA